MEMMISREKKKVLYACQDHLGMNLKQANIWLRTPHPELRGATPEEMIVMQRDQDVLGLIDKMKDAGYKHVPVGGRRDV